jgi:hypothetical protein
MRRADTNEWRIFLNVIEKARESCKTANNPVLDHFVDTNKTIPVPKGGEPDREKQGFPEGPDQGHPRKQPPRPRVGQRPFC